MVAIDADLIRRKRICGIFDKAGQKVLFTAAGGRLDIIFGSRLMIFLLLNGEVGALLMLRFTIHGQEHELALKIGKVIAALEILV